MSQTFRTNSMLTVGRREWMVSAEWLFKNHLRHSATVKLLNSQVFRDAGQSNNDEENESIESMTLHRHSLEVSSNKKSESNPTERIALMLCETPGVCDLEKERAACLEKYQRYLALFDYVMGCLSNKERWLVHQFFVQGVSLANISLRADSPYEGYTRTSIWRCKERILQKADSCLSAML